MCVCVCVCVYVCMYVCMHVYIYNICTYICIYIYREREGAIDIDRYRYMLDTYIYIYLYLSRSLSRRSCAWNSIRIGTPGTCEPIFQGAPLRLPKPLPDQFPVRVCSCPLCMINRLWALPATRFSAARTRRPRSTASRERRKCRLGFTRIAGWTHSDALGPFKGLGLHR